MTAAPDDRTPGGWELRRALDQTHQDMRDGFAGLNKRLDHLVTAETFNAETRRLEDRIKDLSDDLASERVDRAAAIAAEREARVADLATERADREKGDDAQQKTLDKLTANIRWVTAAIILPIALFVATLLINTRGGNP